jgi:hypothetical protein
MVEIHKYQSVFHDFDQVSAIEQLQPKAYFVGRSGVTLMSIANENSPTTLTLWMRPWEF